MLAFVGRMPARPPIIRRFVAALVIAIAVVTVGLTASSDSPFTISVHTAFLRLGIDVDIKLGSLHLNASWSAIPSSTKPTAERF
jgi:hypothetical protein